METEKQPEKSTKRVREEGAYIAETTTETKFKLIYNKRPKLSSFGKKKITIDIEETDLLDTNTDLPETNVATTIINESITKKHIEE